jgi:hypothetical protein
MTQEAYRVVPDGDGCIQCGHNKMWTIEGPDEVRIGSSWGEQEFTEDVCDLMNMAFAAGQEASVARSETEASDAARYRWWRSKWAAETDEAMDELNDAVSHARGNDGIDAAIDAAIKEGK